MNTKPVPVLVMLAAGCVSCVVGIVNHFTLGTYVRTLLIVMVGFYLVGCILKIVLDKCFRIMQDPLSDMADAGMSDELIEDLSLDDDDMDYMDGQP